MVDPYPSKCNFYQYLKMFCIIEGYASGECSEKDYDDLTIEEKHKMPIDEVFAFYLWEVSRKTNEVAYSQFMRFVISFRECINTFAPITLEWIQIPSEVLTTNQITWFSNDLVCEYYEEKKQVMKIDRDTLIDMLRNLFHWLHQSNFTTKRLFLTNPPNLPYGLKN